MDEYGEPPSPLDSKEDILRKAITKWEEYAIRGRMFISRFLDLQ